MLVSFHFRNGRSTASFRYRNRAELITVVMCEQKPYPGGMVFVLELKTIWYIAFM